MTTNNISSISPVRLGVMAPLTGLVDMYGSEITRATQIACEQVNAAGGVLGRPLEIVVEDDGSLPDTAVPAANRLIYQHGCAAIIGNLLSNSRIAVATKVADRIGIPLLNFSFYEGSIYGRYFFHFASLPNQQVDKMIPWMARHYGPKMYFAGSNYEWPLGSIDAAKLALLACGGEIVGENYLPIGSPAIDEMLECVAHSGADVFVPYFAGHDQVNVLRRFAERGLKSRMKVVMGHFDEVMASQLPAEVREGLYSCNSYFMSLDTEENQHLLDQLSLQPDVDGLWPAGNGILTNFGEGAFLCVMAFAKAVNQAGVLDAEAIVEALKHVELYGPQGWVKMDPHTHHAHVNSYLVRCGFDGAFEVIERFEQTAPEIPLRYQSAMQRSALTGSCRFDSSQRQFPAPALEDARGLQILHVADAAVIVTNEEGSIIQVNQSAAQMFGYLVDEMSGLPVNFLLPPQYRVRHQENIKRFLAGPETSLYMSSRGHVEGYRKDGACFPAEATISKLQADGRSELVITLRDITERKDANAQLAWRATHDALTRLPNRMLIQERLGAALRRSIDTGRGVALMVLDIDSFHLINDCFNHELGDALLIAVTKRLIEHVRPGDIVARIGSDEFAILCEQFDDEVCLANLASRLNEVLREIFLLEKQLLHVTVSIGVAFGFGNTHDGETLLRNANMAMSIVKEQGRDGWQFYSAELQEKPLRKLAIASGLRMAIERKQMHALMQPIVDMKEKRICGVELLLRWNSSEGALLPESFISIAEETGAILPIGRWIFEEACRIESDWRGRWGENAPYVSVNVSARQLDDIELAAQFSAALQKYGANPTCILLEITETSLMSDVEKNMRVLRNLATLGLRVAVDDFGTGYSSLAQLLRLPVSTIKIDRAFIEGLEECKESIAITNAIIGMGKALEMVLIAEGVENTRQLEMLETMQCDAIQGFGLYRPMEEGDVVRLIEAQRKISTEIKAK